jgi:HlyD family secretion protein
VVGGVDGAGALPATGRRSPMHPHAPDIRALLISTFIWIAASACGRAEMVPGGGGPPGTARTSPGPGAAASEGALSLRRGDFERRLALTGEVDAVAPLELKVPRVPNGKVPIRYLAAEGAEVKAGDLVVELDSTTFVLEIKDRTLQLSQAEIDLERQMSQNGVLEADKALEVERKRAVVKRAEVDADVPEGILPQRDYLEKQLVLARARADLEKAEEALAAQRTSAAADVKLKRITVEKLRRAAEVAQQAVNTLVLHATAPGTVMIGDHQEERRKLQEGDEVNMGMTVARLTSSSARRVRAWLADVDDGKVAPGMPARVVLDAYPDRVFKGVVRDVSPVARTPGDRQAQRRVFTVNVDLEEADAGTLRPGLSARVEVLTERKADALLVPRPALSWTADGPRALLADGGEVVVALGGCNRDVCLVTGGLDMAARLRRALP